MFLNNYHSLQQALSTALAFSLPLISLSDPEVNQPPQSEEVITSVAETTTSETDDRQSPSDTQISKDAQTNPEAQPQSRIGATTAPAQENASTSDHSLNAAQNLTPAQLIENAWQEDGGSSGPSGPALSDVTYPSVRGGWFRQFTNATAYLTPQGKVYFVRGGIRYAWGNFQWESGKYGYPQSNEELLENGVVKQKYENGDCYYIPGSGTYFVGTNMLQLWETSGGYAGSYGLPRANEIKTATGYFQPFQGGSAYWSPATGGAFVRGAIAAAWGRYNWENGRLGFPVTNEETLTDGIVAQQFQGGSAYYVPRGSTSFIWGAVQAQWENSGGINSPHGAPISDEIPTYGGVLQRFQNSTGYYSPASGPHFVSGNIAQRWGKYGWEGGTFGFPTSEPYYAGGRLVQNFQFGQLSESPKHKYFEHNVPATGQPNGYYCGPASGYMVLSKLGAHYSASGEALSMNALASSSYMNTNAAGYTSFHERRFERAMNNWLGRRVYRTIHTPTINDIKEAIEQSDDTGYPVVVDEQERRGGPHFNNHPNATFSHIMVVDAYNYQTDEVSFADPGFTLWSGAQPKFWYPSLTNFTENYLQIEVEHDNKQHVGIYTP